MTQRIEFIIPGRISPKHRAEKWFNRKTGKMVFHRDTEYDNCRKRIRTIAGVIARQNQYVVPPPKTIVRLYLHFHIGSHVKVRLKSGKPSWRTRNRGDIGNLQKSVEDALGGYHKQTPIFFGNDKHTVTLPFEKYKDQPDPFISIFDNRDGRDDWTEVMIEAPACVEQSKMALEEQF